jgi:hypothetical protein
MLKKDMPTGVILFDGKSRLDGTEIVAIATGFKSVNNHKTGKMIQVWILPKNIHPCEARRNGQDKSICGDCKHRDFKSCYVEMLRGPVTIYRAYKAGSYVKYNKKKHLELFRDKYVRLGAYGDPVAIPLVSIEKVCQVAAGWTGYTHQWKRAKAQSYKKYLMASVDTTKGFHKEFIQAQTKGWRTFRATTADDNVVHANEFVCPASKEGGKKLTCQQCGACSGSMSNRPSPVIQVHGFDYKIRNFTKGMKCIKNKKKWRRIDFETPKTNPIDIEITEIDKEIEKEKEIVLTS